MTESAGLQNTILTSSVEPVHYHVSSFRGHIEVHQYVYVQLPLLFLKLCYHPTIKPCKLVIVLIRMYSTYHIIDTRVTIWLSQEMFDNVNVAVFSSTHESSAAILVLNVDVSTSF